MSLEAMYQEIILDHYKHPRGAGVLDRPLGEAHHVNPTCGDEVTVQIGLDPSGGLLIGYLGQGCSISQASASVMAEALTGRTPADAWPIREAFLELMHGRGTVEPDEEILGDGVAFAGVAKYPARVKCALLAWMALQDAAIKAGLAGAGPEDTISEDAQADGGDEEGRAAP
ncbi:MAG: SUF system NifU family Fe-S cluster assembly protein [Actinomycetales bacterium]|nr:SUF system NifU family Fe-S cluster assembly protein [Actinomycetales bacterium]